MEQHLGRKLIDDEEVDHIDTDFTNDDIDNLQVLTKEKHIVKTITERPSVEILTLQCIMCQRTFTRTASQERHNRKQGKRGPFCDRSCSGYYGTIVQNTRPDTL